MHCNLKKIFCKSSSVFKFIFFFIFPCVRNLIKDIAFKIENVEEEEEIEIKEPCVISAYSPVDDFNKLLESGMNSERGTYLIICQIILVHNYFYILF